MKTKIVPLSLGVVSLSALFCATIWAWTAPSNTPPDSNVNAPINTGSEPQAIAGTLTVAGGLKTSGIETEILKINPEDLLVTPEAGAVEFSGSHLYFTGQRRIALSAGSARQREWHIGPNLPHGKISSGY